MDITLTDIPDEITEKQVTEWVSILIERFHNQKIQQIPELQVAQTVAQKDVDSFRIANKLEAKYTKVDIGVVDQPIDVK